MKILFCQLRNHGDIIRTFPLMDAVKSVHPDWFIGFTCYPEMVETCGLCESIDFIFEQPRLAPVGDTQDGTRILDCSILNDSATQVKKIEFDIYVDLHGVFQSAMFGAICNIKTRLARSAETAKDGASLFYTDICHIQHKEINRMERHFLVINKLFPEIVPAEKSTDAEKKVIICPGSSKKGKLKRWNLSRYIELSNKINKDYKVIFVLGTEDIDIERQLKATTDNEVVVCDTWQQVEKQMQAAALVIGNDAAHIHLAVWKNIPAIEICGPLSPTINGIWKYGKGETIYFEERCKCENLWKGKCDFGHRCLEQISVERVLNVVDKYLQ